MSASSVKWPGHSPSSPSPYNYGWQQGESAPAGIPYTPSDIASFSDTQPSYSVLYDRQIEELTREIRELKEMVGELAGKLETPPETCIEIRDIPFHQAKEEIAVYSKDHDGEEIYPSDIQKMLGIEFSDAMRACDELAAEGKIKVL